MNQESRDADGGVVLSFEGIADPADVIVVEAVYGAFGALRFLAAVPLRCAFDETAPMLPSFSIGSLTPRPRSPRDRWAY